MIGILAGFVTLFGTSSLAQTNPTTYYACLQVGGTLSRVNAGTASRLPDRANGG